MTEYTIYKVDPRTLAQTLLGHVTAENYPDALLRAFAKWPNDTDWRQAQAGFRAVRDHS